MNKDARRDKYLLIRPTLNMKVVDQSWKLTFSPIFFAFSSFHLFTILDFGAINSNNMNSSIACYARSITSIQSMDLSSEPSLKKMRTSVMSSIWVAGSTAVSYIGFTRCFASESWTCIIYVVAFARCHPDAKMLNAFIAQTIKYSRDSTLWPENTPEY